MPSPGYELDAPTSRAVTCSDKHRRDRTHGVRWRPTSGIVGGMTSEAGAVFIFTQDGDARVCRSLSDASRMEAIDVDNGEYPGIFLLDGRIVTATTVAGDVVLTVTEDRDYDGLRRRMQEFRHRSGLSPLDDLVEVAYEWLRGEWEHRWPKRPRWLARRVHGDAPPSV